MVQLHNDHLPVESSRIRHLSSPQSGTFQMVFRVHQDPKEVESNASKGMDMKQERGQAGQEQKAALLFGWMLCFV